MQSSSAQSYTFSHFVTFCFYRNGVRLACHAALCPFLSKVTLYYKICNFSNFCNLCNQTQNGKVTPMKSVTFYEQACKADLVVQSYKGYRSYTCVERKKV